MGWDIIDEQQTDLNSPFSQPLLDALRLRDEYLKKAQKIYIADEPMQLTTTWQEGWTVLNDAMAIGENARVLIIWCELTAREDLLDIQGEAYIRFRKTGVVGQNRYFEVRAWSPAIAGAKATNACMLMVPCNASKQIDYRCYRYGGATDSTVKIYQFGYIGDE